MPQIAQINSKKGMVVLSKEDMIEYDLMRWLRNASKGVHGFHFIDTKPFESIAAQLYSEEYPGFRTKVAEAVRFNEATEEVSIVLQVTDNVSSNYYNHHNTNLVFRKEPKNKVGEPEDIDHVYKEAEEHKRYYDIIFLQNTQDFDDFSGSGGEGVEGFFNSTEDEMFDYLMQWYTPESESSSFYDAPPWGDSDISYEKELGNEKFIMSYNPNLGYAGLVKVETVSDNNEGVEIGLEE